LRRSGRSRRSMPPDHASSGWSRARGWRSSAGYCTGL
jgi:hypothetical protein